MTIRLGEIENTAEELVVAYFNILSQHSPRGTKEKYEQFLSGWIALVEIAKSV
jgi:hypothetical protein